TATTSFSALSLHDALPISVYHDPPAPRIPDDEGAGGFVQLGRVHEVAQLFLIHGRRYGHVRNAAHVGQVVCAVMGGAVCPRYACPVQTENYLQVLDGHVVDYLVVGALHERGVNIAERDESLGSEAGRKGYRMLFGDSHV